MFSAAQGPRSSSKVSVAFTSVGSCSYRWHSVQTCLIVSRGFLLSTRDVRVEPTSSVRFQVDLSWIFPLFLCVLRLAFSDPRGLLSVRFGLAFRLLDEMRTSFSFYVCFWMAFLKWSQLITSGTDTARLTAVSSPSIPGSVPESRRMTTRSFAKTAVTRRSLKTFSPSSFSRRTHIVKRSYSVPFVAT